jgi:hypothetical protein
MRVATLTAGLVAWIGAALASLCCLLPLTIIGLAPALSRDRRNISGERLR